METGEELGVNKPGEIYIKGPCVMKGYYNNPTATAGKYLPLSFSLYSREVCDILS